MDLVRNIKSVTGNRVGAICNVCFEAEDIAVICAIIPVYVKINNIIFGVYNFSRCNFY